MKIAVTGHRPDKLFGYNLAHPKYTDLKHVIFKFLNANKPDHCISGMALGVDTVFAQAVLQYKETNTCILECAIPCLNHSLMWNGESRAEYNRILSIADKVTMVSEKPYSPKLMQKRNEYMVDLLGEGDILLAIYNGDLSGGTYNCIKYAKKSKAKTEIITVSSI